MPSAFFLRPMPIVRAGLAALALACALADPAAAQEGNQSNTTGPNITGSGGAGGSFLGAGLRFEHEMFVQDGTRSLFRSAGLGCAVRLAAREYLDSVAALPATRAGLLVDAVLSDAERTDLAATLAERLTEGLSGEPAEAARALAAELPGLFQQSCDCPTDRGAYVEAPRWERAIRAYNDLVSEAPASYLTPPPAELVAVRDALYQVVMRALTATRVRP